MLCARTSRDKSGRSRGKDEVLSTLDYKRILRNFPDVSFTYDSSENGEERLPSFRLIVSTAVESRSYAEVRTNEQARSDASNACPLHLLCKCGVPARGGVWLKPFSTGVAHFYRTVARVRIKCRMSYAHSVELKMFAR